jgi:mRNA-decapping enzyme 1B
LLLLLFPLHEAALASMAHGGGGRAKVTPNLAMDEEGTRVLNITVLQRLDPAVEDILITAGHVTLYDFDTNLNQWSRKDVEGSLFVVKRFVPGFVSFLCLNLLILVFGYCLPVR